MIQMNSTQLQDRRRMRGLAGVPAIVDEDLLANEAEVRSVAAAEVHNGNNPRKSILWQSSSCEPRRTASQVSSLASGRDPTFTNARIPSTQQFQEDTKWSVLPA